MKMIHKLIILFSVLFILTTSINTFFIYNSSLANLNEKTAASLTTIGNKMRKEMEQYMELMDYALEELTSDVDFMDAFYRVAEYESREDESELLTAQNVMSQTMYQIPLQSAFYRVSAYTRNGFYLTSRFEKTDTVVSFSDEARETVEHLDYLDILDNDLFTRYIVPPHNDPWTTRMNIPVFSAVKALIWHGHFIGYIEVSASVDDLNTIFLLDNKYIQVQAVFEDGRELFNSSGKSFTESKIAANEMKTVESEDGSTQLVVMQPSKSLGLNIYVSQDIKIFTSNFHNNLSKSLAFIILILIVTLALIFIISYSLTRAIGRLGKKIKQIPTDELINNPEETVTTMVTKPYDREIYELEQSFNDLVSRLQLSHKNYVVLSEGALTARLNSLQLQINPHFVYNTLNIISAKAMESGNEEIPELCSQFAQMLRYSTDLRSNTALLREEIEHVREYLYLCKARYEDNLEFIIDVPNEFLDVIVPKLTLQPIVENSLRHGLKGSQKRIVSITGKVTDEARSLIIHDNGNGFSPKILEELLSSFKTIEDSKQSEPVSTGAHLGLINTYLRLFYNSRGKIRMKLYNDNGAVVELVLPSDL